jgi:hypothetical protein
VECLSISWSRVPRGWRVPDWTYLLRACHFGSNFWMLIWWAAAFARSLSIGFALYWYSMARLH